YRRRLAVRVGGRADGWFACRREISSWQCHTITSYSVTSIDSSFDRYRMYPTVSWEPRMLRRCRASATHCLSPASCRFCAAAGPEAAPRMMAIPANKFLAVIGFALTEKTEADASQSCPYPYCILPGEERNDCPIWGGVSRATAGRQ